MKKVQLHRIQSKTPAPKIVYGLHSSPFGRCLIALAPHGICHLSFPAKKGKVTAVKELARDWKQAQFVRNDRSTGKLTKGIFRKNQNSPVRMTLKGTDFQIKVWKALLKIRRGSVISYEKLAHQIGKPNSVRAVARAVASNSIAYLIPCHRVIRKNGEISGYRWGPERKKAMLVREAAFKG